MNPLTMLIGAAGLVYGLYTLYLRGAAPEKFGKLQAMKEKWGPQTGSAIHLIAYTLLPIAFGVLFLYLGWRGVSFF